MKRYAIVLLLSCFWGPLVSQVPETSYDNIGLVLSDQSGFGSNERHSEIEPEPESNGILRPLPPAPANDNCSAATLLLANSGCSNGTFVGATTQSGENTATSGHCGASAFTKTVWYKFVAISSTMWLQTNLTGLAGSGAGYYPARFTSVVYNDSVCQPALAKKISCANMNTVGTGDGILTNNLTGLSVGKTYLVQLGYNSSNGSQDPLFCIRLGNQYSPACNTCSTNCGQACGFPSTPTVAQVTASCPNYQYIPYIEGSQNSTRCHSFIANNSSVAFQVIVNSTCGAGNVTNFTWSLYSSNCGAAIQTGTLASMNFTGLIPGQKYIFCYSFTVPAGCYHTTHYPYFIGAQQLPVTLIHFQATAAAGGAHIRWITASEQSNNYFELKRSFDGKQFETVKKVAGAGTSYTMHNYEFTDPLPPGTTCFYRLDQMDFNGTQTSSETIAFQTASENRIVIAPNPADAAVTVLLKGDYISGVSFCLMNQMGEKVFQTKYAAGISPDQVTIPTRSLPKGIYTLMISSESEIHLERIVKQ